MKKISLYLFLSLAAVKHINGQIIPKEASTLNYKMIGFYVPSLDGAIPKIEIARGYFVCEDSFKKNKFNVKQRTGKRRDRIICEVPEFGQTYTWREVPAKGGKTAANLHHFTVGKVTNVDTSLMRLRVVKKSNKYKELYIFTDGNRVLYNTNGEAVWYLPTINGVPDDNEAIRDLKLSPAGTITFLHREMIYEVNYDGEILWKGPTRGIVSGDSIEHFHHEFTRLRNGHYMTMGKQFIALPGQANKENDSVENAGKSKTEFGTVIEYDSKGEMKWQWKSSTYFLKSGFFNTPGNATIDVHENSFYFDEANKNLYVSFRDIGKILKVKYPEGTVINTYGNTENKIPGPGENLFCYQHSCKKIPGGGLVLFNNNCCHRGALPKIEVMQEPASNKGPLKKTWEYECPADISNGNSNNKKQFVFKSGGNVVALNNKSFFVSASGTFEELFIVSIAKEKEWSAIPEFYKKDEETWRQMQQYRASVITNFDELERLIWNK